MGFWGGLNSKNPSKSGLFDQKVGVYSRKTQKTGLFNSRVGLQSSGYGSTTFWIIKKEHLNSELYLIGFFTSQEIFLTFATPNSIWLHKI